MKKNTKMTYMALLIGQALILYIVEGMIPVPFITPGAKLGLANLITIIAIYTLDSNKEAFTVVSIRILLSTMFGGNLSTLMYSISGSVFSFLIMILIKQLLKDKVSVIGMSASGAVFHNIGQLLVACMIVKNIGVMLYLPVLTIAGIGTGIFVGITSNYLLKHMQKLPYFRKIEF